MFQNQNAIRLQQLVLKYQVWYLWQFGVIVGRVSKYEVKFGASAGDEFERIALYQIYGLYAKIAKRA